MILMKVNIEKKTFEHFKRIENKKNLNMNLITIIILME